MNANTQLSVVSNESTIADLISIDFQPAVVTADLSQANTLLDEYIERYNVVITQDGVKAAKKDIAELRKTAKQIDDLRKDFDKVVMGNWPDKQVELKAIINKLKDSAIDIDNQVKKFEEETLELIRVKLIELLDAERDTYTIDEEFRTSSIDGLVKLGSLTATGNLSSKAGIEVRSLVQKEKEQQSLIEVRLLVLENQSYKAGLKAPLTRAHVEAFLFDSNEIYQSKLNAMLESEKQRQAVTEQAIKESVQEEAKHQVVVDPVVEQSSIANDVATPQEQAPSNDYQDSIPEPTVEPAIEYAYGPRDSISSAVFETLTRPQVEAKAIASFPTGNIGIWTEQGLVVEIIRHEIPKQ